MADDELLRRLDLMQTTLELAFKPQLDQARAEVRSDAVSSAILDLLDRKTWMASTTIQKKASKAAGVGERSVRTRLSELVDARVLDVQGSDRAREYRRTGLV
jgi:hypothetical protein